MKRNINTDIQPPNEYLTTTIISSLLILLFIYTGISKLIDHHSFKSVLEKSPLLGSLSGIIAIAIPTVELSIAILLLVTKTKRIGLISSLILLSLFTLYLIYMVIYTPHLPCSCGGVIKKLTWRQHIFFNIGFILITLFGIISSKEKYHIRNRYSLT